MTASHHSIGFVTCAPEKLAFYFPTRQEPDFIPTESPFTPDDQLLVDHLRAEGFRVEPVQWGTSPKALNHLDLLVIRSPWDYMDTEIQRQGFIQWLDTLELAGIPVENTVPLIRWLVDKHYLGDFRQAGIGIVPTEYWETGESFDFEAALARLGPYILKPCLSAAAKDLFHLPDAGTIRELKATIQPLMAESAYMCQPFLPEIQTEGEWSLIFLNGEYSHAVHKKPKAGGILVQAEQGGSLAFTDPPQSVIDYAETVMAALPRAFSFRYAAGDAAPVQWPLYLRIDLIPTAQGLMLSECEGVEPELFIRAKAGSSAVFARGIRRRLGLVCST